MNKLGMRNNIMTTLFPRHEIREFANKIGISFGSCHAIFTNVLGMIRAAAKIIPKLLNYD